MYDCKVGGFLALELLIKEHVLMPPILLYVSLSSDMRDRQLITLCIEKLWDD